jgi:hypothetical protein
MARNNLSHPLKLRNCPIPKDNFLIPIPAVIAAANSAAASTIAIAHTITAATTTTTHLTLATTATITIIMMVQKHTATP